MPINLRKFGRALTNIRNTPAGKEASMYPYIRDVFLAMGHQDNLVITDSRNSAGGRPDVAVEVRDLAVRLSPWIVVEAKDEHGTFSNEATSNGIFAEKWRYVSADTEWFVGIDPSAIRLRKVTHFEKPVQPSEDEVILLIEPDEELARKLAPLGMEDLKVNRARLNAFRAGEEGTFSRIAIDGDKIKALFLGALKSAAQDLITGAKAALYELNDTRQVIRGRVNDFHMAFPSATIKLNPFRVLPGEINAQQVKPLRKALHDLRELNRANRTAFLVELDVWPEYLARTAGKTETDRELNAEALLVEETAALLLSRILLLRFFEDYEYFHQQRYLCNGGVKAFQAMREQLKLRYPELVRTAYAAGSEVYPSLFDASSLDWVLRSNNEVFSATLEHAMMLLAEFNFRTIREELLSSIYGVFFDESQRKRRGEHYTPPSIARWMIKRACQLGVLVKKMLDPACGFGTFVVGGWQELIGRVRDRGGLTDVEAEVQVTSICGNDLNSFSATLAQMQLLWNLIQARPAARRNDPLPPLSISAGEDSLNPVELFADLREVKVSSWSDIDGDSYPLVAGNPPWVRPERRDFKPSGNQEDFFREIGANSNIFMLFVYKALQSWIEPDGRLAFVIPLTFVDTKDAAPLRNLFLPPPEGKWKLLEIVDFEVVKRVAFPSANVRPIIIFAQKALAFPTDNVSAAKGR